MTGDTRAETIRQALRARIEQRTASSPEGCWEWQGHLNAGGYGQLYDPSIRKTRPAHRIAYELWRGEIPEDLTIDHLCRNRACVNPWHLEPVTNEENILRGDGPTARNARKTHCKRGHEFTPENTGTWQGARHCLACQREKHRASYAANPEADRERSRRNRLKVKEAGTGWRARALAAEARLADATQAMTWYADESNYRLTLQDVARGRVTYIEGDGGHRARAWLAAAETGEAGDAS